MAIEDGRNTNALTSLAEIMRDGDEGVERNSEHAVKLFEMAIEERRVTDAMTSLGAMMRDRAAGVGRNPERAAELFKMAIAEEDDATAIANLVARRDTSSDGGTVVRNMVRNLLRRIVIKSRRISRMIKHYWEILRLVGRSWSFCGRSQKKTTPRR